MQVREYVNSNMAQHTECMFNEYKFSEGLYIGFLNLNLVRLETYH